MRLKVIIFLQLLLSLKSFSQLTVSSDVLKNAQNVVLVSGIGNFGFNVNSTGSVAGGVSVDALIGKHFILSARYSPGIINTYFKTDSFAAEKLNLLNKNPYAIINISAKITPSDLFFINPFASFGLSSVGLQNKDSLQNLKNYNFQSIQGNLGLQLGFMKDQVPIIKVFGITLNTGFNFIKYQNGESSPRALETLVGLQNNPNLTLNKNYFSFNTKLSVYVNSVVLFFEFNKNYSSGKNSIGYTIPNLTKRDFFTVGITAIPSLLNIPFNNK